MKPVRTYQQMLSSGDAWLKVNELIGVGRRIESALRKGGVNDREKQAQPVLLDGLRGLTPGQRVRYVYCDPGGFFLETQRLLADLGPLAQPSLRRILNDRSSVRLRLEAEVGTIGLRRMAWARLVRLVKRELGKVRKKILGIDRSRPPRPKSSRPGHLGRPRHSSIDKAVALLEEKMDSEKVEYPQPRERWQHIFAHMVCPTCIQGWATLTEDERKYQASNLRKSLHARGGVGKAPGKIRKAPMRRF
jgi:hypothetical protein